MIYNIIILGLREDVFETAISRFSRHEQTSKVLKYIYDVRQFGIFIYCLSNLRQH